MQQDLSFMKKMWVVEKEVFYQISIGMTDENRIKRAQKSIFELMPIQVAQINAWSSE